MRDEKGRFLKGYPPFSVVWNKGKHHSEEIKKKMSEAHKGKSYRGWKLSKETRNKMIKAKKGNKYVLGYKHTEESKKKISGSQKGKIRSEEHRKKLSEVQKREKNHRWKGGITPINKRIRHSIQYKLWREAVFERDNWTCQKCGARSGNGKSVYLHPHHIKSFSEYPDLRFDIKNGKTLCVDCHELLRRHKCQMVNFSGQKNSVL